MRNRGILLALGLVTLAGGCNQRPDEGPVVVSVIGETPRRADPSRGPLDEPARTLMGATAQGLVRFDAAGQVEPGLAERWIVIDNGMSYIFRLREAEWADGTPVTASAVVTRLRAAYQRNSRNPLRPYLGAIDEIVTMTPQVLEIRLRSPRPELLKLLAQPELALFETRSLDGTGPYDIARDANGTLTLSPAPDLALLPEERPEPDARDTVVLRGERAALAIARFAERQSDLVAGGTILTLPLLATADLAPVNLRTEPVNGLFGLAIVEREGFLAEPANRAAIAMAIDRAALAEALGGGLQPIETILPERFESSRDPGQPEWATLPLDQRRALADARVAIWRAANPDTSPLRLALPAAPGSNLLFGRIAADLRAIGLSVIRVPAEEDADLRLVDSVAPHDNARWFLAEACRPCGEVATFALDAVRDAPNMTERAARMAEANDAVEAEVPFIPLARPIRWSLVSQRLQRWTANPRGAHPLNHLRGDPN